MEQTAQLPRDTQPRIVPSDGGAGLHVAIIMDGNGRWAEQRGMPRRFGHQYGATAAKNIIQAAPDLGVTQLTLFAFSTENWSRPWPEVSCLMNVLRTYLRRDMRALHESNVRLTVIGDLSQFPFDIVEPLRRAEELTARNTGLSLSIALGYGGRADIVAAARRLAALAKDGDIDPAEVDENAFLHALPTAALPDVDLLIRTSGEQRVSNFLLWQLAYAEMLFTDRYWPDFSAADLKDALATFHQRHRRYGGC
jgi:undecaprenyl diphosphate synthase